MNEHGTRLIGVYLKMVEQEQKAVVWYDHEISREDRECLLKQKSVLLWFTGLSGSGKSTIANELEKLLLKSGKLSYLLDGDNVRHGLNKDLGFSADDRKENIRRIGEVANLFVDSGVIILSAFISPYKEDRAEVRKLVGDDFVEVYVKCGLAECERRDPKGMYKKARAGEINQFTGISDPYEEPENPEIVIDSENKDPEECAKLIYDYLSERENKDFLSQSC